MELTMLTRPLNHKNYTYELEKIQRGAYQSSH